MGLQLRSGMLMCAGIMAKIGSKVSRGHRFYMCLFWATVVHIFVYHFMRYRFVVRVNN
ncbi:hypothetical protein P171DRAFT_139414 [Karstenula rhodostoma CBS 690.94]|uniref:Uncharacterized protein n=1 Tax=Karstenula rhodostoma CBS 690.94 TaxID=1392251 RepID=A0A9P4PWA0_9PLEO|nr:hypothetical protein P171DRAFT_139414 [Karstenula rhodostoma CBS 690.94]